MKNASLWNKIKFFFEYRRIIKRNKARINGQFNLRIDRIYRLYTVLNLPEDAQTYGKDLTETYIKKYLSELDKYFKEVLLSEIVGITKMEKIDGQNYLIVFSYAGFDTSKVVNRILIFGGFAVIASIILKYLIH